MIGPGPISQQLQGLQGAQSHGNHSSTITLPPGPPDSSPGSYRQVPGSRLAMDDMERITLAMWDNLQGWYDMVYQPQFPMLTREWVPCAENSVMYQLSYDLLHIGWKTEMHTQGPFSHIYVRINRHGSNWRSPRSPIWERREEMPGTMSEVCIRHELILAAHGDLVRTRRTKLYQEAFVKLRDDPSLTMDWLTKIGTMEQIVARDMLEGTTRDQVLE